MRRLITVKRVLLVLLAGACAGVVFGLLLVLLREPPPPPPDESHEPLSLAEEVDRAIDDGFVRLESGITLTADDKRFLLQAARATLEKELAGTNDDRLPPAPPNILSQKARIFVTLLADGRTRGCMSNPGENLLEQTVGSTKSAIADRRFGGAFREDELPAARIDITMLLEPHDVTVRDLRLLKKEIEVGVHAFSLERGPGMAFFKSSVPVAHGYNLERSLEQLGAKAGIGPQAYRQRTTRIRKYVTLHFAESPVDKSLIEICRYNLPVRQADVTRDALRRCLRLCGDYMANHTADDGVLTYLYNVYQDKKENPEKSAAFVRGVASTWIMAELGSALNERRYTDAAKRSIGRILKQHYKEDRDQGFGYLQLGADANIATAAFALLAFTAIDDDNFHAAERAMLLRFIFAMEDAERRCLFPVYLPDKESLFTRMEIYYPGEALTALMTIHERTRNPECLALTERVFDYYTTLFDRTQQKPGLTPWMSKAYARAFLATRKRKYADFVFKMNDRLLKAQRRPGARYADKIGSFFSSGASCNTGAFTEGLVEAYRVAKALKDEKRMKAYGDAIALAGRFLLQCQYRPENMFTARNRAMALGGMRTSVYDSSVRIDCVQHAACALLRAAQHVYE